MGLGTIVILVVSALLPDLSNVCVIGVDIEGARLGSAARAKSGSIRFVKTDVAIELEPKALAVRLMLMDCKKIGDAISLDKSNLLCHNVEE